MGNQLRQESQLEQLKQRIAESAKKAGLDSEFETVEKNIRVRRRRSKLRAFIDRFVMTERTASGR